MTLHVSTSKALVRKQNSQTVRLGFVPICASNGTEPPQTALNSNWHVQSDLAHIRQVAIDEVLATMIRIPSLAPFFRTLPTLTEPLGEGHSRRAERLSPTLFCYPIPWLQSETGMGSRGVRRQLVCCRPISKWKDGSAPRCLITSRKHRTRSM
jgi:hypothetical protein